MLYRTKVWMLRNRKANLAWRRWRAYRGDDVGSYDRLPEHVRQYAPGKSFLDVGCMWGVNGEFSFVAEDAGATTVTGLDVFGPTPEFEAAKERRGSAVSFVLGDITDGDTIQRLGVADVVLCAGVLYHHPSPFDVLVALRRVCGQTLILRTSTIPEMNGMPNAAVFYPMLAPRARRRWNLSSLGLDRQVGITDGFEPEQGYGNWFWGLTPSCLASLLAVAGFRVIRHLPEAFVQTFICEPADVPFAHHLPSESAARSIGADVSARGIAHPA
ncbi:MAG TPA: DUF1698 domain-containing protein [Acidimicrobiales bacterium]|nr:DUF1698 domain-containing protein [Acidimicrobiales bacterium]